jgi:ABC-type branched-subunit amino acid transport system ATPase component
MHEGAQLALGDPQEVTQDKAVIEAYLGEDYA